MIVFEKLRYQNFLSTGNNFIEFILNQHDTTLIVGANGSGKSTLLDALSFVLFGKAYRKINKPQLVNSITKKNCLVEVEFTIGEVKYMVRRGIAPNIFEVYQDDRLLNQQANSRDYQEILEEQILKAAHKSFCQIVVLGTAAFEPFMQLPSALRREVIEDLLDLQVFTAMNLDLKERASQLNKAFEAAELEKASLEKQLELLKHHADIIENSREQSHEFKMNRLKELEEDYDELVIQIHAKEIAIDKLFGTVTDEHIIAKKTGNLREYVSKAAFNRDKARKDVKFMEDHATCPTCTREMPDEFRKSKIDVYKQDEAKYVANVAELSEALKTAEDRLAEIKKVFTAIQDHKLELQVLKTRKASISKQIDELKKDVESLTKTLEITDAVAPLEKALEERSVQCVDLEGQRKIYHYASLLLKDQGIKSKIIKQYIPIINSYINKYLSEFETHINFYLDEHFNETIKSRNRDDFSYESFSQGERQRIDLAILFAWRAIAALRNTINTNILILDEVFDSSLDNAAIEYLMNIIRIHAQTNNIIVISHKDQMNDKFENIIRFQKVRNFSLIGES